jgi:NDP-sugar pyrophosphorylase family protein
MTPINLVMPMAGGGSRFKDIGINEPKPLIKIKDRPFFFYAVESIRKFCNIKELIFIVLKQHEEDFNISAVIKGYYPEAKIIIIPELLNGPVLTCLNALKEINNDYPVIFNDCDHCFNSFDLGEFFEEKYKNFDGALLTFISNDSAYSYCKEENGLVKETVEKNVVSDKAICGSYIFRDIKYFTENSKFYMQECSYKEFFMSGVFNSAIKRGGRFVAIKTDFHISFGTPKELELCRGNNLFNSF